MNTTARGAWEVDPYSERSDSPIALGRSVVCNVSILNRTMSDDMFLVLGEAKGVSRYL